MIDPEQLVDKKAKKREYDRERAKTYTKSQAFQDAQYRYLHSAHGYAKTLARKQSPKYKATEKARYQARRDFLSRTKLTLGCIDCGYKAHPAALEFDHVEGEKRFNVGGMGARSWESVFAELAKCVVRCANCHRIKTMEERGLD